MLLSAAAAPAVALQLVASQQKTHRPVQDRHTMNEERNTWQAQAQGQEQEGQHGGRGAAA